MVLYEADRGLRPVAATRPGAFPPATLLGADRQHQGFDALDRGLALTRSEHGSGFFYIYLPHLDYAAQKPGPTSPSLGPRTVAANSTT